MKYPFLYDLKREGYEEKIAAQEDQIKILHEIIKAKEMTNQSLIMGRNVTVAAVIAEPTDRCAAAEALCIIRVCDTPGGKVIFVRR